MKGFWMIPAALMLSAPAFADSSGVVSPAIPEFGDIWGDETIDDSAADGEATQNAAPETGNYRVIGRGLRGRDGESILQMACVGEPDENSGGEKSCRTIQFLHTNASGFSRLIGQSMTFSENAKLNRKAILKELRAHGFAPPKVTNTFQATSMFYGDDAPDGGPMIWLAFSGGVGIALSQKLFATGAAVATFPAILCVVGVLSLPVISDLIRLPFQIRKARREFGSLFGEMGPRVTVRAIQDRSRPAWQLKPKVVSTKGLRRFIHAIEHPVERRR